MPTRFFFRNCSNDSVNNNSWDSFWSSSRNCFRSLSVDFCKSSSINSTKKIKKDFLKKSVKEFLKKATEEWLKVCLKKMWNFCSDSWWKSWKNSRKFLFKNVHKNWRKRNWWSFYGSSQSLWVILRWFSRTNIPGKETFFWEDGLQKQTEAFFGEPIKMFLFINYPRKWNILGIFGKISECTGTTSEGIQWSCFLENSKNRFWSIFCWNFWEKFLKLHRTNLWMTLWRNVEINLKQCLGYARRNLRRSL